MSTENTPTPDPERDPKVLFDRFNERLRRILGPNMVNKPPQEPPAQGEPIKLRFTFISQPRESNEEPENPPQR